MKLLLLIATSLTAHAQDSQLAALRKTLEPLRVRPAVLAGPRGAGEWLTTAKHQLRDWVESQLSNLAPRNDEVVFAHDLNQRLVGAQLLEPSGSDQDPFYAGLGYVENLDFSRKDSFLIVKTGIAIQCGYDESAYVYEWKDNGWIRKWDFEENTYTNEKYHPQTIAAVKISPYNKEQRYLVLAIGVEPWCSSNWHNVYYSLWRLAADERNTKLLLKDSEWGFVGTDQPIAGAVTDHDVLIEYTISSIDAGAWTRPEVRHYEVIGDNIRRVPPIALSPRDFADEWLQRSWTESSAWANPGRRQALQALHSYHDRLGDISRTTHCRTPDLWQVALGSIGDTGTDDRQMFSLIRWQPPYRFTMMDARDHAWPTCTEPDPAADEHRTLFPH
jgi:hypothetical protein